MKRIVRRVFAVGARETGRTRRAGDETVRTGLNWRTVVPTLIVLCTLSAESALAINGILFYGVGARNRDMGGANGAAPVDTSTIIINPAGLGRIGNTADMGAHALFPERFIDRTNANPNFVNTAAGLERSGQWTYVTPFSGVSWRGKDSPLAVGMTICGVAGEGATVNQPRIRPDLLFEPNLTDTVAGTGDAYDTSTFIMVIKAVPAVSYELTERLSVGAAWHVNVVLFSADLAIPTAGGQLVQTAGRGRAEVAYLMGLAVGALYDISDRWSVGLTYTTPQWQLDDFSHYEDLIPDFELPHQVRLGFAHRPAEWLRLTADYKYIGWEAVELFGRLPSQGGFGWRDQHTVGLGAEVWLTSNVIARLGWNYGKSPIRSDVLFANALVPVIYESHLAGGVELLLGDHHSLAFSAVGTMDTEKTDDGSGDLFSQAGAGTRIGYEGFDVDATWTIHF
ncbi:MAG: OmpP1/FadL family transporter [Planctomycetota bacterium]